MLPDTRQPPRLLKVVAFVGISLAGGAFVPLLAGPDSAGTDGNPLFQTLWSALGLTATCYVAFHMQVRERIRQEKLLFIVGPLFAAATLAALSASYSTTPGLTLRKSIALFGTLALAIAIRAAYGDPTRLATVVRSALLLGVAASFAYALISPDRAFNTAEAPGLVGVFSQKNSMGQYAGLGAVISATLLSTSGKRIRETFYFSIFATALVLSQSTSAVLATGVALLVLLRLRLHQDRWPAATSLDLLAVILLAVGVLMSTGSAVTSFLGKTDTLSGRTLIWEAVWPHVQARPFLGHGYTAFWETSTTRMDVLFHLPFVVSGAHNGYLDLLLDLGLLGLALVATFYFRLIKTAIRSTDWRAVTIPVATFVLVANLTESALLLPNAVLTLVAASLLPSPAGERSTGRSASR